MSTDSLAYLCNLCGKSWDVLSKLEIHVRSHTGERPYACDQCGKAFSVMSNLNRHVRTVHSIQKPFQCQHCGKTFNQNSNLKRHHFKVHHLTSEEEDTPTTGAENESASIGSAVTNSAAMLDDLGSIGEDFSSIGGGSGMTFDDPVLATVIPVDQFTSDHIIAAEVMMDLSQQQHYQEQQQQQHQMMMMTMTALESELMEVDEEETIHQFSGGNLYVDDTNGAGGEDQLFTLEMPIALRPHALSNSSESSFMIYRPRALSGSGLFGAHSARSSFEATANHSGSFSAALLNPGCSINSRNSGSSGGGGGGLLFSAAVFKPVSQSSNYSS
eukprot:TRINITY_DN24021_c0_g2_i1.p1 TRINITY_DN24021_c0_g2~~TRINITY_DN24021_c0_g2_i1.p1  ORF type:complete len:328 (+),score=50.77 TRINITY_DN24021_c0_g2_i1:430-1413(+)